MFLCTVEHAMNTRLLRMNDLKRCYGKTQSWCASPTRCFLCGIGSTTSRLRCHTLADYIVMIHLGTYLYIQFYLTLLKGLWSCSQPWLIWTSKFSFFFILEKFVLSFLFPMFDFSKSCVGVSSLIMWSQAWCMSSFEFRGLESYSWSNSRMFFQ